MSATPISLQPVNNVTYRIADKEGTPSREFVNWLIGLVNSFLLIPQSTAAGPVAYPLPPAASMPNREIILIKTSADGNALSVAANGTDLINAQGAWGAANYTVGTAQGAVARLRSDGQSNYYVC
jgi:hypothetical protein